MSRIQRSSTERSNSVMSMCMTNTTVTLDEAKIPRGVEQRTETLFKCPTLSPQGGAASTCQFEPALNQKLLNSILKAKT